MKSYVFGLTLWFALDSAIATAQRTDRYGDPLPKRAVARLGTVRLRHPGTTYCVAFSPNGKVLVSGDRSFIRFWNGSTGKLLREFPVGAYAVAFSPDGKTLASAGGASGGPVRLWDR